MQSRTHLRTAGYYLLVMKVPSASLVRMKATFQLICQIKSCFQAFSTSLIHLKDDSGVTICGGLNGCFFSRIYWRRLALNELSSASNNAMTTHMGISGGNSSNAEGSANASIKLVSVASSAGGLEALGFDTVQSLPGISVAKALRIWRDAAKYQAFLRQFADRYAGVVQKLRDADAAEGQAIAHKFRGAAANLGLEDVAAITLAIEQSLKQGETPQQALQELQQAMTIALGSIARYAPPESQTVQTPPSNQNVLAEWLTRLLAAWHSDSSSNVERVLAEQGHALPAESRALLQAALLNYDFRAGEAATAALMQSLQAGRGAS